MDIQGTCTWFLSVLCVMRCSLEDCLAGVNSTLHNGQLRAVAAAASSSSRSHSSSSSLLQFRQQLPELSRLPDQPHPQQSLPVLHHHLLLVAGHHWPLAGHRLLLLLLADRPPAAWDPLLLHLPLSGTEPAAQTSSQLPGLQHQPVPAPDEHHSPGQQLLTPVLLSALL